MSKKKVSWQDIGTYTKLPNRKRNLLTKEFLQTFKDEIVNEYVRIDKENGTEIGDYSNYSWMRFYGLISATGLFYNALKTACEKHNLVKAIYSYTCNMPWYDSDCFESDLVYEMVNKGVVDLENELDDFDEANNFLSDKYKLVKKMNGYSVIQYDNWYEDGREDLEKIYKDSEWEVIWLDSESN